MSTDTRTFNTARYPYPPQPVTFAVCVCCGGKLNPSGLGGYCPSPFCPRNVKR